MRYVPSTTTSASRERALEVAALVARRRRGELLARDRLLGIEDDLEQLPLDVDRPRARRCACSNVSAATAATGAPAKPASSSRPFASPGPSAARTPGSASAGARSMLPHARVRMRRAQHGGVQHPRQLDVGGVARLAAHALRRVLAASRRGRRPSAARRATARADPPRRRARPPRSGPRPPSRCGSVSPMQDRLLDSRIRAAAADVARHRDGGSRRRSGSGFAATSAAAETTCPGVQKPHCTASARTNASISGWSRSPSIVVISPRTLCASVMHESVGMPSTCTVHAPQWPSLHAIFVPVSPSDSRNACARLVPTGASTA